MFNVWARPRGLRDALPLSLQIDNPNQVVGGKPTFTLIGAPPGATVYWSSYKDDVATAEFNTSYNQVVESNGTAQLVGGEWATGDVGSWIKEVLVQDGDKNYRAVVRFRVAAAAPAPSTTPPGTAGNFLSQTLFSIGSFRVTGGIALVGLGLLYFGSKRR